MNVKPPKDKHLKSLAATTPEIPSDLFGRVQFLDIEKHQEGQRIDNFLLARLKGVPKSRIYRILRKGEVRVNKGRIKPEYKIKEGDVVRIPPIRVAERDEAPQPGRQLSELLRASVLYDTDELLVVNKPAGLAVHGGSGVSLGLIEALRKIYPEEKCLELVHRLDRDTSGCLMIAKSRAMLKHLQEQMQQKQVRKFYLALVEGKWNKGMIEVSAPLQKNQLKSGERFVCVSEHGKPAITYFSIKERFSIATLLRVELGTGRTHQIRVHCQSVGHGLAGDEKYGEASFNAVMKKKGLKRMFLHAEELEFCLLDGKRVTVRAPLPDDLTALISDMQGN